VDLGRLDLSMDWRVFAVAIGTTVLTLVGAAWLPVRRFTRARLAGELIAGPTATASVSSHRMRQALLALHVSATIVVLVTAGLFVRAVIHGFGGAPGFDANRMLSVTLRVDTPLTGFQAPEAWMAAYADRTARVKEAIRGLPGVADVAEGRPPIDPESARQMLAPRTVKTRGEQQELIVGTLFGSSELLSTLGVPILAGRGLTRADADVVPTPAVVTASLARRLWPDGGLFALGQDFVVGTGRDGGRYEVVGIAGDFVFGSLARPADGVVVILNRAGGNRFVVRAASPETLSGAIRQAVGGVVSGVSLIKVETGRDIIARDLGRQRLGAWFFSGFGLAALILGVGGVFGLVAYLAESRRREFAVRLALGATPRDLMRYSLRAALTPVSLGVMTGLALAAVVARLFASLLTGLTPLDPLTYAVVGVTMVGCAALAGWVAAWPLRRMMPSEALRTE
jgi:putative ABC transport system permease protein